VARDRLQLPQRSEALAFDGESAVLFLEAALDDERARPDDDGAVLAEEVGAHDGLAHAGLVFERQEDESLRRARALPDDDGPRGRDALAVGPARI
jgi:hypothetical protein